jgi:hypothetical protein
MLFGSVLFCVQFIFQIHNIFHPISGTIYYEHLIYYTIVFNIMSEFCKLVSFIGMLTLYKIADKINQRNYLKYLLIS